MSTIAAAPAVDHGAARDPGTPARSARIDRATVPGPVGDEPTIARSPFAAVVAFARRVRTPLAVVCCAGLIAGCATTPPAVDVPKVASRALARPDDAAATRSLDAEARQHPGMSGFRLLQVGVDGYLTRVEMADAAVRSLDVQYFIFRSDQTGRRVTDALLRAADRGVRVRILVDDGETLPGDERVQLLDAHPNIEVRVFNPFRYRGHDPAVRALEFAMNGDRLDYRMHNKLIVADNSYALVGGRNVADEYFQVDPARQFADDDLFVVGPIVPALSDTFDAFWNSEAATPVAALAGGKPTTDALLAYRRELQGLRDAPLPDGHDYRAQIAAAQPLTDLLRDPKPRVWATSQLVCDSPDKKDIEKGWRVGPLMVRPVADAVAEVHHELLMVSPYLVPGDEGMSLFSLLRQRGATVRLLTNSMASSTVAAAQAGYMHYRLPMLEDGIELYEIRAQLGSTRGSGQTAAISRYGNYSLHGKMFVFDRRRVFIGSMNFDQRSMHLNTEIGVLVDSETLAAQVAARFQDMVAPQNAYQVVLDDATPPHLVWRTVENGTVAEYDAEPARDLWQRLQTDALTLVPMDSEL